MYSWGLLALPPSHSTNICVLVQLGFVSASFSSFHASRANIPSPSLQLLALFSVLSPLHFICAPVLLTMSENANCSHLWEPFFDKRVGEMACACSSYGVVMLISSRCNGLRPLTPPVICNDMCFWKGENGAAHITYTADSPLLLPACGLVPRHFPRPLHHHRCGWILHYRLPQPLMPIQFPHLFIMITIQSISI